MYDIERDPDTIRRIINDRRLFDVLRISVDLDLYTYLSRAMTAHDVSASLNLDEHFVTYLLETLRRAQLVEMVSCVDGSPVYRCSATSSQYLNRESPLCLGRDVFHEIETGRLLERYINEGPSHDVISTDYWTGEIVKKLEGHALLGGVQSALKHVDLAGRSYLLDIGGGHGLYSIFFAQKYLTMRACILDLPQVIAVARGNIARFDIGGRVHAVAGDYHTFEAPHAYDTVFASNVTSTAEELRVLLTRAHGFLGDGGAIILRNYVSDSAPDIESAVVTLERYSRRGHVSLARSDLVAALRETGYVDVSDVYAAEGVAIVRATKEQL